MEITYRQGQIEDCSRIAELDNIASDGAIEFLFHDLVPGASSVQIVASSLENDRYPYTYRSVIAAEYDKKIVGMSLSFPGKYHKITEEMRGFFPEDRLCHFKHFFSAPVQDDYFLDALCVDAIYRKKGIGNRLIDLTKAKAIDEGFDTLSLLTFTDNIEAQAVYRKNGFDIVGQIELKPDALMPHEGGCLLMRANL